MTRIPYEHPETFRLGDVVTTMLPGFEVTGAISLIARERGFGSGIRVAIEPPRCAGCGRPLLVVELHPDLFGEGVDGGWLHPVVARKD